MGAVLTVVSCGGGSSSSEVEDVVTDVSISKLSEELVNTLSYMGNEERLAYDVYNALSIEYPDSGPLKNISDSEYEHITAVQQLIQKYKLSDDINFTNIDLPALGYMNTAIEDMQAGTYDIAEIQKLYDDLVAQGSTSEIDALKVGCIIEVVDVNDLNDYIDLAQTSNAPDIEEVFTSLRAGSYNHYWSFYKGLEKKGISNGCCSLGEEYCKTEEEYPQSNEQ